jgi:hypothetical protein
VPIRYRREHDLIDRGRGRLAGKDLTAMISRESAALNRQLWVCSFGYRLAAGRERRALIGRASVFGIRNCFSCQAMHRRVSSDNRAGKNTIQKELDRMTLRA